MSLKIRSGAGSWQAFKVTAPSGGYDAGQMVAYNDVVCVVATDTDSGDTATLIYNCPRIVVPCAAVSTGAGTVGSKVYYDSDEAEVTETASGSTLCGIITKAASTGDTTVEINLIGTLGITS
jgi:predicted RecA/RadA family phage recombinase